MAGKISLYGTIVGLVVILLLSVVIGEGLKGLIYIFLSIVGFFLLIILISKLFSFLWFRIMFFVAIILLSQFYIKSWIFTISLTGIIVLIMMSQSHSFNKKWRHILEVISLISLFTLLTIYKYLLT